MRINTDKGDLVLSDGVSLSITKKNVMIYKENEEFSLNNEIPRERNLKIFGHWYRQKSVKSIYRKMDCSLFSKNIRLFSGTVHLTESDEDIYEIMLKGNRNDILTKTAGLSIQKLPWENQRIHPTSYTRADMLTAMTSALDGSRKWYAFPVFNKNYMDDTDYKQWANQWDFGNQAFLDDWRMLGTVYPRVCYLLEDLFNLYGYTVESNYLKSSSQWNKLCIYNNVDLIAGTTSWKWGAILPDMKLDEFLEAIERITGTTILINSFTRRVQIIQNSTPFLSEPLVLDSYILKGKRLELTETNGYELKFAGDKSDTTLDNEGFYEGDVDSVGPAATFDALPAPGATLEGTIYEVTSMGMYYICKSTNGEPPSYYWDPWCGMIDYVKDGEERKQIEIKAYPVLNGRHTDTSPATIVNPGHPDTIQDIEMLMDVPEVAIQHDDEVGLRFFFYRGMADAAYTEPTLGVGETVGEFNTSYPQGSFSKYKPDGTVHSNATVELMPAQIIKLQSQLLNFMTKTQPTSVKLLGGVNLWNKILSEKIYIIEGNQAILDSATIKLTGDSAEIEGRFLVRTPDAF